MNKVTEYQSLFDLLEDSELDQLTSIKVQQHMEDLWSLMSEDEQDECRTWPWVKAAKKLCSLTKWKIVG